MPAAMNMINRQLSRRAASQRGVSLLFALFGVVLLAFAALALVRSVDTGTLVAGNLGFKQDATAFADRAAEEAITDLTGQVGSATLNTNGANGTGYYATSYAILDPTNKTPGVTTRAVVDWDNNNCGTASYAAGTFTGGCLKPKTSISENGNAAQFVITRLCSSALAPTDAANVCAGPLTTNAPSSPTKGAFDYLNNARFELPGAGPYYRIIVRVVGARNTVSYTETIVHY